MAIRSRRRPAVASRRGKANCADSKRTNQILTGAAAAFGVFLLLAVAAWLGGWIEIAEGDDDPLLPSGEAESHAPEALQQGSGSSPPPPSRRPSRTRLIVLSAGEAQSGINTGEWAGWGGADPESADLKWAAAGVRVHKACDVSCRWIKAQPSAVAMADAVVIETVNHPKFGHDRKAFPWPKQSADGSRPLVGAFYMEPPGQYPPFQMGGPEFDAHVDFSATSEHGADVPVSLMCPWGMKSPSRHVERAFGRLAAPYLAAAPVGERIRGNAIAFFSDRGIDPVVWPRLQRLAAIAGVSLHAYSGPNEIPKTPLPAGFEMALSDLPTRLRLLQGYRAALIAQSSRAKNWIEPELSHALVAGAVPVVWGAENLGDLMPSPGSFIDASSFGENMDELWESISSLLTINSAFEKRQQWRLAARAAAEGAAARAGLGAPDDVVSDNLPADDATKHFMRFASDVAGNCVHHAECRICRLVHDRATWS